MTATILLIRHAAHEHLGRVLSGRLPGLPVSEAGARQAERLAAALSETPVHRLHTSPVQRARETAVALTAGRDRLMIEQVSALDEIDFGAWAGRSFAELDDDPAWRHWNAARGSATPPGGESMRAAQQRAWAHVSRTAAEHPGDTVAMVSHCDIIRALVVQILGLPLDAIHRFDIDPASLTRVAVGEWGAKVLSMNEGLR